MYCNTSNKSKLIVGELSVEPQYCPFEESLSSWGAFSNTTRSTSSKSEEDLHLIWYDYATKRQFTSQEILDSKEKVDLAITAAAMRRLNRLDPLQDVDVDCNLEDFIGLIKIVGRANAPDKVMLVQALQQAGKTVGFVGDGLNDCASLRASDCGIALLDKQDSLVSAFSTKRSDLSVVIDVLRHGKSCLAAIVGILLFGWTMLTTDFTTTILAALIAPQFGSFSSTLSIFKQLFTYTCLLSVIFSSSSTTLKKTNLSPIIFSSKNITWALVHFSSGIMIVFTLLFGVLPAPTITAADIKYQLNFGLEELGNINLYQTTEMSLLFLTISWFVATLAISTLLYVGRRSLFAFVIPTMIYIIILTLIWGGPSHFNCFFGINCDNASSYLYNGNCIYGGQLASLQKELGSNFMLPRATSDFQCRYYRGEFAPDNAPTVKYFGWVGKSCTGPNTCLDTWTRVSTTGTEKYKQKQNHRQIFFD